MYEATHRLQASLDLLGVFAPFPWRGSGERGGKPVVVDDAQKIVAVAWSNEIASYLTRQYGLIEALIRENRELIRDNVDLRSQLAARRLFDRELKGAYHP